jgi:NAD(P)-dependent dehydrogenase (short-subunit alcohol dehydrogenase family)
MKDLKDKVAVVTGGASGLGLAMARRFAAEGMKLVLADIEEEALRRVELELRKAGVPVIGIWTDVSRSQDIERLAEKTLATFGAAHVLCNNAGVAPNGAVWENTVADWEWVLGVNVWGVIHGVRVFTPILLRQGDEGHIVNTASVAGLIAPPGMGMYNVSKHAVVALTETLHHDLAARDAKVKCSVVCPAYFPSGIAESERARPAALREDRAKTAEDLAREASMRKAVQSGRLSAADIAERVFEAVRDERFYVLTHPRILPAVEARMRDILAGRNPGSPL